MMTKLIDQYMPSWDYAKTNQIQLNSLNEPDLSKINQLDFSKSRIIKILFFLRGMSTKKLTLDHALKSMFILLDQNDREIVLGLIAQPWKLKGNIFLTTPDSFHSFDQINFVKATWNFRYEKDKLTGLVSTETRILCTSISARRKFSIYWVFISFFSGIIRKEMLKIIKDELFDD